MPILSFCIMLVLVGRMIEIYIYCSIGAIPFATMTNREWGQMGNNYLRGLVALGLQRKSKSRLLVPPDRYNDQEM